MPSVTTPTVTRQGSVPLLDVTVRRVLVREACGKPVIVTIGLQNLGTKTNAMLKKALHRKNMDVIIIRSWRFLVTSRSRQG